MNVFSADSRYNSTWLGHILRTCFTPKIVFVLLAEGEWKRLVLQRQSLVVEVLLKNIKRETARWWLQCVCVCVCESFIPRRDVRFWTSQPNSETLCTYFLQAHDRAPVVSCFAAFSPACRCNAAIPDIKASSCTAHVIWMWYVDTDHMTHTDLYALQVCRAVNCQHFILAPVDLLETHDNHSDLAWQYFTMVYIYENIYICLYKNPYWAVSQWIDLNETLCCLSLFV